MKKILLTTFISVIYVSSWSQTSSSIPVKLKNGTQFYANNISEFIEDNSQEEIIEGNFYKFVQFNAIPSQEAKNELIALGLIFLEYIPENTYLVSFPSNFDKTNLLSYNVRSIQSITNNDRITQLATERPFPSWSLEENNLMVFISFYSDLNFNTCLEKMQGEFISVISTNNYSNNVLAVINPSELENLLKYKFIRTLDLTPEPGKPEGDRARNMHRSTQINSRSKVGRKYDGTGVVVVDNDDGIVGPHIDFTGRMTQPNVTGNSGNHGDMTAGIIGGYGNLDPTMGGMAPGCDLIIQQYSAALPNTVLFHTRDSAVIFSSSYSNGCNAGYTSLARQVDQEIRLNPTMIQVFSAGNSNNQDCGYGAGNQWGNVTGGHKQGKNVIATANLFSDMSLISSSSRGPADDGRIKPDISANGNGNLTTDDNNQYRVGGGTSAACPSISGVMAQMYNAYQDINGVRPESGLMKAIILNTAEDFGNVGPDFKYGWGRVDALRSVEAIEAVRYLSANITNGGNNTHQITIPANVKEVKVMVYWHDYEGSTSAAKALVNDLDVKLELGSSTFLPWILDITPNATNLDLPATKGVDTLNNVEQVSIVNPAAGNYSLKVAGTSVPQGPQKYFVTYEFIYDEIRLANPNGGEGFVPGVAERIFWDAVGNVGNFNLSYSVDSGINWISIGAAPAANRAFDWNVPNNVTGKALVKIERGLLSDISEHTFSIISRPTNLTVTSVCPSYMEVSWTAVTGADEYEVYLLGNKYMDSVGRTSGTTFQIPITNPNATQWFSVSAIKNNNVGNKGRRQIAEFYAGGLLNCILPNDAGITSVISPNSLDCFNGAATITVRAKNIGASSISNLDVKYRINGGTIYSGTIGGPIASQTSINHSFATTYNFTTVGTYVIETWTELSGDSYINNDTTVFNYNYAPTYTIPYSENFNSFSNCSTDSDCEETECSLGNGYTNLENGVKDDIDWRTNTGSTPSNGTGPSGDHTSGFGKYLYLESSGNCYNQIASFISPCIDLGTTVAYPFVTFWYHLYGGASIDSLTVDVFDGVNWNNSLFKIEGNQSNNWNRGTVDLTPFTGKVVKLRFNGGTGAFWNTDMAVDDINISDHTSINEDFLTNAVSLYPNPNNGEFKLTIDNAGLEKVEVTIFDIYGRMVYANQLTDKVNDISLLGVSAGVYTVRITANEQSITKKIVVN